MQIGPAQLDYDNAILAGMQFKYTLFVKVTDEGSPVLSSKMLFEILKYSEVYKITSNFKN